MNVGKIVKYGIDRLEERNIELRFDCPHCGAARIGIKYRTQHDIWNGVVCPKCKSRVILDNLSLTVVKEMALQKGVSPAVQESATIS